MHALIKTCGILIVSRELSDARGRVVRETPAPCRARDTGALVPRRDACASFVRARAGAGSRAEAGEPDARRRRQSSEVSAAYDGIV